MEKGEGLGTDGVEVVNSAVLSKGVRRLPPSLVIT